MSDENVLDLSAFEDTFKTAEVRERKGNGPVPDDTYQTKVATAGFGNTKAGAPQFVMSFTIVNGDFAGRQLWKNTILRNDSPIPLSVIKSDLAVLGHSFESLKDLQTKVEDLLDTYVEVAWVTQKTNEKFHNCYLNALLDAASVNDETLGVDAGLPL